MLNTIDINLKTDIKIDSPTSLPIKLMSQDKNNNKFILRFTSGGEPITLDDTYTVEVLTKFTKSGTGRLTSAVVRHGYGTWAGYATWKFDTDYITQDETVYNYVYVRKSGSLVVSADSNAFYFEVGLSEIDKTAGRVAETYDENYQRYLDSFKDNVNLEEIGQAEQARIQAETDRELAELDRQATFENNETTRQDTFTQAEATRAQAESDRQAQEEAREQAETERVSEESNRASAEVQRKADHANRSVEFDGKADKVVIKNLIENGNFKDSNNDGVADSFVMGSEVTDFRVENNTQYWTSSGLLWGYALRTTEYLPIKESNKYYISMVSQNISNLLYEGERIYASGENPLNGKTSHLFTATKSVNYLQFRGMGECSVSYLTLIDLTEIFGAGNEPTKEEMDELINVTGYINDEYALNNKEMLNWQLKLMRQNRNALIALGGTII